MRILRAAAPSRRARLPLLIWIVTMVACAVLMLRAHYTADLSAFLPKTPTPEQALMVSLLRDGPASRTVMIGIDGGTAAQRAQASQQLAARLRGDAQFSMVQNGSTPADEQARDQQLMFSHRYLLSPAVDAARFSVAGLHAAIGDALALLASPAGMSLAPLLARDPTGETVQLIDAYSASLHVASTQGVWSSGDGQRALLIAQLAAPGSDTDAQQGALSTVQAAFAHAAAAAHAPLSMVISGPPSFAVNTRAAIHDQVVRLSAIGSGLIVILLLLVYRSPTTLLLGLLPVLSGAAAGVAAVSVGFGTVHGLTLGFGTTLIGEAVDYSIYLFIQSGFGAATVTQPATHAANAAAGAAQSDAGAARATDRARRLDDWVRHAWPTVRLGALTSIVGFASLLLSGFPGLAQLGVYSISGLIVAAAVTRWVLPLLIPASLRPRDLNRFGIRVIALIGRARRWRALVAVCALAAAALLGLHHARLWNTELSALSPIPPGDQALDARLRNELGAPDALYFVVARGSDAQSALQRAEQLTPVLQQLVSEHTLQSFESPSRYLPSIATQRARQAQLPPRAELAERLTQATRSLPLQASRLTPFLDDVDAQRQLAPVTPGQVKGTSLALALDTLLLCQPDHCDALLPVRAPPASAQVPGGIDHARIRAALRGSAAAPAALFIDLKEQTDQVYAGYLHQAIGLSAAGLLAIVVLLAAALRSVRRVARVIAPLAAAVLVVAALLSMSGAQLTLLHLVGMLLVVALGSNYALFFEREAGLAPTTVASLLFANLATMFGFGVLAFSTVPLLRAFGETVAPGALLVLIFSAMLSRCEDSSL